MRIDDQLRGLARRADQHQQVITAEEIVQRASRGRNGSFTTRSGLNDQSRYLGDMTVLSNEEEANMIDLDSEPRTKTPRKRPARLVAAGLLAAAGLVAIALVAMQLDDAETPADQPSPNTSVPALGSIPAGDASIEPGTYLVPSSAWSVADFEVTFPDGWTVQDGHVYAKNDGDEEVGFHAVVVDDIWAEPCAGSNSGPPSSGQASMTLPQRYSSSRARRRAARSRPRSAATRRLGSTSPFRTASISVHATQRILAFRSGTARLLTRTSCSSTTVPRASTSSTWRTSARSSWRSMAQPPRMRKSRNCGRSSTRSASSRRPGTWYVTMPPKSLAPDSELPISRAAKRREGMLHERCRTPLAARSASAPGRRVSYHRRDRRSTAPPTEAGYAGDPRPGLFAREWDHRRECSIGGP